VSQRLRAKRKGVDLAIPSTHRQAMAAAMLPFCRAAPGAQRADFDLGFGFDGLAFGGVIMALNIAVWAADWLRRAADIAAVVHMPLARLAQDSHALMKGFLVMVQATPDLGDTDDNSAGLPDVASHNVAPPARPNIRRTCRFLGRHAKAKQPCSAEDALIPAREEGLFCWHIHCLFSHRGRAMSGERAGWVRSATP